MRAKYGVFYRLLIGTTVFIDELDNLFVYLPFLKGIVRRKYEFTISNRNGVLAGN